MPDRPLGTTRMILHAAARVLGCGSVQMAMVDETERSLVFLTSITNRELERLAKVESTLGFQLEGAHIPLAAEQSLLVRACRDGRVMVTHDVSDLAGGLLDAQTVAKVHEAIGPRTFAAVPIAARSGALGVLLFEKPDESGFSAEDRELLVAYADRVGADLESQALSDEVSRLDAVGRRLPAPVLYACDRALALVSHPVGQPLWQALGVDEGPVAEAYARAVDGPTTAMLRDLDGRLIRLTLAIGPEPLVVAAAEDMEESERLRREAARARELLAKVLRSIADAILTLDAGGLVASSNEAVQRMLGLREPELHRLAAMQLCADERSRERAEEMRHEVRATGFAEAELRLRRKDDTTFAAKVSALLLADDDERPAGMVWRIHDLTEPRRRDAERKRLRARLLRSERLSALGEMAARIAHEVRNPLVSIGAAAQVVAEELPAQSPVAGEVQAIAREVRRLDGIVSDFLRFARPRRVELRLVDLEPVLRESVELVRKKATADQLRLSVDGPLKARCDADSIKQVLLNVLLNAMEAAPPSEAVECEARVVGDQLVLSVADRGPGVPESARRRVFDPFFSTKSRGTGLGLAVSKQIIDEHNGRIRLVNRRGGGTRVVIELPVG